VELSLFFELETAEDLSDAMKCIALRASILLQSSKIDSRRTNTMATTPRPRQGKGTPAHSRLLALDLGLKPWKLGFARTFSDRPWRREIAGGDGQALLTALAHAKRSFKLPATTAVRRG
jgi:hypothetical protein